LFTLCRPYVLTCPKNRDVGICEQGYPVLITAGEMTVIWQIIAYKVFTFDADCVKHSVIVLGLNARLRRESKLRRKQFCFSSFPCALPQTDLAKLYRERL
ncbi:hypothetical protein, partial [Vibrio parahaemolyticus]|uniref:hypothetical protein n=1 Tax=Vibrio parahaemolyticus TaxID=670 RepID=UPI001BAEE2F0